MRCILSFKSFREYGDERIKIRGDCVRFTESKEIWLHGEERFKYEY